jgi:hypothetical protein
MVKIKTRATAMATYKKSSSTNNVTFNLLKSFPFIPNQYIFDKTNIYNH